jgi:hypothetical protein
MNNYEIQHVCIVVCSANGAQLPHESLFLVSCVFNSVFCVFSSQLSRLSKEDKSLNNMSMKKINNIANLYKKTQLLIYKYKHKLTNDKKQMIFTKRA